MSALVVLGAGDDQLPTYVEARAMGLRTIGFDARHDAPGRALADEFVAVDVCDADAVLAALDGRAVAGATSPAVDRGVPTLRALSAALGIGCDVPARAAACTVDKTAFRVLVDELGLPTYRSVAVDGRRFVGSSPVGLPAVVKPTDSSGSKGVAVVTHGAQLVDAVREAARFSRTGCVVIEEQMVGRHLSAEVFLDGDGAPLVLVSERLHTGAPGMVTLAHRSPADLSSEDDAAVADVIARVGAALGIRRGPMNVDLVLDDHGDAYVIEVAARLGGNGLPRLVEHALGVNTVRAAIDVALGQPVDVTPRRRRTAVLQILATDTAGTVGATHVPAWLRGHPNVVDVDVLVGPGQPVRAYDRAAHKLGYLTVVGDEDGSGLPDGLTRTLAAEVAVDVHTGDGSVARCAWRFA